MTSSGTVDVTDPKRQKGGSSTSPTLDDKGTSSEVGWVSRSEDKATFLERSASTLTVARVVKLGGKNKILEIL